MTKKLLTPAILIVISLIILIFIALNYGLTDKLDLNRANPKLENINQEVSDDSEVGLQKQLNAITDTNYDSDLDILQAELTE